MAKQEESKPVRKFFGTDGVRSRANISPMTAEQVLKLGRAAGYVFRQDDSRHTVVIGKDTRLSGYMFESALRAGFTSMGIHCMQLGTLPTPAVAYMTRALRANAGVMISASHNPYHDNGIKFFDPNGMKLPDEMEAEIERVMFSGEMDNYPPKDDDIGRATLIEDARGRYIEFCKNSFPKNRRLTGLRVVVDCANGAAYKVAPAIFWELGAEVIAIGNTPNGLNINDGFGSLHPEQIRKKVQEVRADIGIALDGDADRLLVCDEKGNVLDGDHLLAMSALAMKQKKSLKGGGVVATVMSNLGLERFLAGQNLKLIRTQVGDRYVLEHMLSNGYNLGGEQSGHLLFLDHNSTGDGLISALKILELMADSGKPLSELDAGMVTVPQLLKNVMVDPNSDPLAHKSVIKAINAAENKLKGRGRVLVRKSGTEPKIRVMMEGDSLQEITEIVDDLCQTIKKASGEQAQ
ncbi:MAG: phosphoglucosamine mutase [Magnetococcales bacterium]|nr:phosphoglucosamine mutase [Magnetococcales bacterium]